MKHILSSLIPHNTHTNNILHVFLIVLILFLRFYYFFNISTLHFPSLLSNINVIVSTSLPSELHTLIFSVELLVSGI